MRDRLTQRQDQVFEFIRDAINHNGKPPTIKEIGRGIGVRSTNSVHKMLVVLEKKGYLRRIPNEARGIELLVGEETYSAAEPPGVLMLKDVEGTGRRVRKLTAEGAAHPLPRSLRQPLLLDPSLVPEGVDLDGCLGVVAGDDGMNGAGVWKGDLVVVEERPWGEIPNGALVAALFHDRVVIRRFEFANDRLHFRVADRSYADESARPDDQEYFVIGRALVMMRSLQ